MLGSMEIARLYQAVDAWILVRTNNPNELARLCNEVRLRCGLVD